MCVFLLIQFALCMNKRKKDLRGYSSAHCSTGVERATGIDCAIID